MPLQIRRGTEAERLAMSTPLALGELLYDLTSQQIFVGDGETIGGNPATGYTNEDAQDAAAQLFTTGSHNNITFSYDDVNGKINTVINLSDYSGPISATSFNGSLISDDSTVLVNVVNGTFNLNGTVGGFVLPSDDAVFDIGSTSYRFRNLYLSGSSITLGSAVITSAGGILNLPPGSTINGVPILTSAESFLNIDINGSVFGNDSTVIVNSIDSSLNTSGLKIQFDRFTSSTGYFNFGNETSANKIVFNTNSASLDIEKFGLSNGAGSIGQRINTARGSLTAPSALTPGDVMYSDIYRGWDGASWITAAGVYVVADSNDTVDTGRVPGKLYLATSRNNGVTLNGVSIDSYGKVGINKQYTDSVDATLDINGFAKLAVLTSAPVTPANGMIAVADGTSWNPLSNGKQSLVAYLGGIWVQIAVAP